jgi:uncharacterized protein (UPF0303 family)
MKGYYVAGEVIVTVSIETDLETIAAQEDGLQFTAFGAETAWKLGCLLRDAALDKGAAMTIEIQVAGRTVFAFATDGAPAGQADWIRRKRNTVMRFGRSSYAMGLMLQVEGKTIEARHGLTLADFAMHGGGFPIVLKGTGLVGSVVVSGLPQREDHSMVVDAMAAVLGVEVARLG